MLHSLNQREYTQKYGCLGIILAVLALGGLSFFKSPNPPKTYSVSHTPTEWQSELDTLAMVQRSIGYALNRQESDQFQAAIARMQQRIIDQVKPQILADTVKPVTNKQK